MNHLEQFVILLDKCNTKEQIIVAYKQLFALYNSNIYDFISFHGFFRPGKSI